MQRCVVIEEEQLAFAFALIRKDSSNINAVLKLYGLNLVELLSLYSRSDAGKSYKMRFILEKAMIRCDRDDIIAACRHYPKTIMKISVANINKQKYSKIIGIVFTELVRNGDITDIEARLILLAAADGHRNNNYIEW